VRSGFGLLRRSEERRMERGEESSIYRFAEFTKSVTSKR